MRHGRILIALGLLLCLPALLFAQTRTTITAGPSLPSTCGAPLAGPAQVWVKTSDSPPTLYLCTATNTWTAVGGGGGGGTPSSPDTSIQFNNSGSFGGSADLTWDGTAVSFTAEHGLLFAGTANPILVTGGDDSFGDTAINFTNPIDSFVALTFGSTVDIILRQPGADLALFGLDDGLYGGGEIREAAPSADFNLAGESWLRAGDYNGGSPHTGAKVKAHGGTDSAGGTLEIYDESGVTVSSLKAPSGQHCAVRVDDAGLLSTTGCS